MRCEYSLYCSTNVLSLKCEIRLRFSCSAAAVNICRCIRQSLTEVYQFAGVAKEQCEVLEGMHKRMMSSYQQMAKYFCFDPKKYAMDEFFGDIKTFIDGFVVCFFSVFAKNKVSA